jgi:hypothetical protein
MIQEKQMRPVLKNLFLSVLFIAITLLLVRCRNERIYIEDEDARLAFNMDTLYFDTVFTTIGTTTRNFRIYNPHDRFIKVDRIELAGGSSSVFRVNVDGVPGTAFENFEIAPNDSMYVFVEATLDPNQSPDILRIQDSITFLVNGNTQDVDLVAWGQDVHMLRDSVIDYDATWVNDKPYLVLGYAIVDTLKTLTIEEGVKLYMHRDAILAVVGSLEINGSLEEPVIIQGDRLEEDYSDIPGQWGWIWLVNGSVNNVIDHAEIRNGTMGLFVNSPVESPDPVLTISNTEINQMSYDGILGQGSSIKASNLVIGDCGNSCMELLYEGRYEFVHCTFANYWRSGFSNRRTPALKLANYLPVEANQVVVSDIELAQFRNCIIYGDRANEILISKEDDGILNYSFDHCLTRIDTEELDYTQDPNFVSIINNENPLFDSLRVSYELDSLSAAIDQGKLEYAEQYPFDKKGESRVGDNKPDLGAFEKIFE